MTPRIVGADTNDAATAALLTFLQLDILGGDVPMESAAGHWWIAYDGQLPIGFAGLLPSVKWSDAGYLCRAGVVRSHRGHGIQKRLIRVRERKARSLQWSWLVSDTLDNPASANSLIHCGYRLFHPAKPWGLPGALYWRKRLKEE